MPDAAAFSACFADWKLIRGRKVVQIVFEVPLERADEAYHVVGGMPDPSTSKWFAIAALTEEVEHRPRQSSPETQPDGAKRSWDEILPSQQAGILCSDPRFWTFLNQRLDCGEIEETADAATWVRNYCGVNTRADITDRRPLSLARWRELVVDYRLWERAVV